MSFVRDLETLPDGKTDARPSTAPANQKYTAAEWNKLVGATYALRDWLTTNGDFFGLQSVAADVAPAGKARLRYSAGALQASLDGAAYVSIPVPGITTIATVAGDNAGLDIRSKALGQTTRVVGVSALAAITGFNTGTAGTGTSPTSLAKPAGGTPWVATLLTAYSLKRISGGGFVANGDNLRPILSNTTTTLAINAMPGLDNTSVFEIVTLATAFDQISPSDLIAIRAQSNAGAITLVGFDFSTTHTLDGLIQLIDCAEVKISACKFSQNLALPSVTALRVGRLTIEHCRLTSGADIEIRRCQNVVLDGCVNAAGGAIALEDCTFVDVTKLSATASPSRVLSIKNSFVAKIEADCNGGGASPLYFEGVDHFSATGGLLTGSGNTGYGIEFANSGHYVVTGSTISGTVNAVLFGDVPSGYGPSDYLGINYGAMATATMGLVAQTTVTKVAWFNNVLFNGSIDKAAREIGYGINNPSNVSLAAAGTSVSTATLIPQQTFAVVSSCAIGAGVKLHNIAVLPGVALEVYNGAANTCLVYPSGGGTINGLASFSVPVGKIAMFRCVDWPTDKWVAAVVLG